MQKRSIAVVVLILGVLFVFGAIWVSGHEDGELDPTNPEEARHYFVENYSFDEALTYYEHIQPIINTNCMGCHMEGQIAGDIVLDDPQELIDNADYIADLVSIRYMPPWMPDPETTVPLRNERLLTEEEIAAVITWAETGATMGEPTETISEPDVFELPDVRQDFVFEMPEPYLPDDANVDDYRCFIADPGFEEPTFVTGFVFEPDQTEQVHHGIIYKIEAEDRGRADRFNGRDGQNGWSCYNDTRLNSEEMVGTWTPGTFPAQFPEDTGYLMQPGDFFVMQVHYWTGSSREPDNTNFYLELENQDADIQPLITFQLLAPVEIPCPDGVIGEQCDRDWAIQHAAERYGTQFAQRPQQLLRECGWTLADLEDIDPENATTYCEFPIFWEVTTLGVLGHMHELGKSIKIELNPGEDDNVVLLDVPRWDFHWQDRYQFQEPITTKPGDVLRLTCSWDNTLSEDPRYVVWGEGTQDEMCFATIMVLAP